MGFQKNTRRVLERYAARVIYRPALSEIILAELVRDAESAARELPRDVGGRAHYTAGAAFDTTLERNLHGSAVLGAVGAHGAELDAGFLFAVHADLGVNNFQVRFMLIRKILERHQNVVDVYFGEIILLGSFSHKIHLSLYTNNGSAEGNDIAYSF